MGSFKKLILYLFIVLLLISIYEDLTVGTQVDSTRDKKNEMNIGGERELSAMRVKVQHGDTVLSVVEEINGTLGASLNISQIMKDFSVLNPTVNPTQLVAGEFYSFPVYSNKNEADN